MFFNILGFRSESEKFFLGCLLLRIHIDLWVMVFSGLSNWSFFCSWRLPLPLPHPMFLMLYCWLFSPGAPTSTPTIPQIPTNSLIWIHALHASDWSNWQYCNAAAGELARGPHLHNHNAPYLLSYHSYTIPPIPPNSIGNTPQYPPNTLIWEHALHAHDWSNWQCRY